MLLEELASDPDISNRANKISTAADRCARIVKTFLAMARQEPSEYRAVDVNEVVASALDVTSYALRSAGIDVKTRISSDLPSIQGDADQLTQVLTNLIPVLTVCVVRENPHIAGFCAINTAIPDGTNRHNGSVL